MEVTYGKNGWHVHIHALLFLDFSASHPDSVHQLHRQMFNRWKSGVESAGLRSPLFLAQDMRIVDDSTAGRTQLAAYLSKAQLATAVGMELTASQGKKARTTLATVTPWQILDDCTDGLPYAPPLWMEWEKTSHGKRQISWSTGLRDLLELGDEKTDIDIAAEEFGTEENTIAIIRDWKTLIEKRLQPDCLRVTETGGQTALIAFLTLHKIAFDQIGTSPNE